MDLLLNILCPDWLIIDHKLWSYMWGLKKMIFIVNFLTLDLSN